jgi:hypothetical protein
LNRNEDVMLFPAASCRAMAGSGAGRMIVSDIRLFPMTMGERFRARIIEAVWWKKAGDVEGYGGD